MDCADTEYSYNHQNTLITLFYRWFSDQSAWALPILNTLLKDLRDLAEQVRLHTLELEISSWYIITRDGVRVGNGTGNGSEDRTGADISRLIPRRSLPRGRWYVWRNVRGQ